MIAAFAWLELRTHCHATEDEERVAKVLDFLAPGVRPGRQRTEGFHRNPIIVLTARTDSRSTMKEFWRLLDGSGLIHGILDNGAQMVDDDGIMHFRLGKQEAFLGRAVLAEGEDVVAVRTKIVRYPSQKGSQYDIAKDTITEMIAANASH